MGKCKAINLGYQPQKGIKNSNYMTDHFLYLISKIFLSNKIKSMI